MANLKTTYMGLSLKNPLIVGSSPLTATADKCKKLEDDGAGAVVLKSIFEEQIRSEVSDTYDTLDGNMHPEAYEYLQADMPMRIGPASYLEKITETKDALSIPVIASINCTTPDKWVNFADKIAAAGADAIELNVYDIPSSPDISGAAIEQRHLDLVRAVSATVTIPISVKIGSFYSSIPAFTKALDQEDIQAIVMFNRFFQPDIDIEDLAIKPSTNLSRPEDLRTPLRWIAITSDEVNCDVCLTGGVHDAEGAIKSILAGANAFQICSVLYSHDTDQISKILTGMSEWMDNHHYETIQDFHSLLSNKHLNTKDGFERAQYMKALI